MARKKIALLVGQPDENYQSMFINGFLKEAFLCDFDVCIFAMYYKFQESKNREQGESNIFSLPDYNLFDGIVILGDTIQTPGVFDKIEEELHNTYKGPVISVDKKSKYFKTIDMDNYTPVKQMISHLIEVHGFTDIAYLTGKEYHPHSKQRLKGFIDCMYEHNLEIGENRVFYGDFWYNSGIGVAEQLLRDRDNLPQAVACANDYMALGVAEELTRVGIRVPEDVAVTGFDVLPEVKASDEPLTSAPIPAVECGVHTIKCLMACFEGRDIPEFEATVDLFIGTSCGCERKHEEVKVESREKWNIEKYLSGFDAAENHMEADLLLQTEPSGIINTIFSYVHQIRPFDSFHICLNTDWMDENVNRSTYSYNLLHALACNSDKSKNKVDMENRYSKKDLIVGLFQDDEDSPRAYIFTPLFFEEHCFGYAAVSYGDEPRCFPRLYKKWLNAVMCGMEQFRRMSILKTENTALRADQIRDAITGLYNYNGFVENVSADLNELSDGGYADIYAIDIAGLNELDVKNGIKGSGQMLIDFSHMLAGAMTNSYMCHLGNGEFISAYVFSRQRNTTETGLKEKLQEKIDLYAEETGFVGKISIYTGEAHGRIKDLEEFEDMVNDAVSNKNGNKTKEKRLSQSRMTKEEREEANIVGDILDDNKFVYHFQPIVDADTGEIYAYEALMRADIDRHISPMQILKYADYMGRLYDVEKATFTNVLRFIEDNEAKFEGKKIFINSIPNNRLKAEDFRNVKDILKKNSGKVVVELTEQAELDDEELEALKAEYEKMGIEIAVDDYGTGYSNITNLLRYMPNYVKIDRMLLSGIQLSPQKQHFVREIIEFAHDNDIKALAEGVETSDELKTVISLGADLIQGFYTATPSADVVSGIDIWVQNEIIQYNQLALEQSGLKNYEAGPEGSISLVKLATAHYSTIEFGVGTMAHRDIVIVGMAGFQSNMDIVIRDNYVGRIELQDVDLCKHKNQPAIKIGEHCDVTLVLTGDNVLEQGGILVPETSKLTMQGDGNLTIKQMAVDGYGIGNDKDSRHGDIYFEHDGDIEISGNIMHGVAIGSGMGGNININRGKYIIHLSGEEGVAIGALYADVSLMVQKCSIELDLINSTAVGIGSLYGSSEISIAYIGMDAYFSSNKCVCIGNLEGKYCIYNQNQATITVDARSNILCGVGSLTGDVDIYVNNASLILAIQGKEAISMGNTQKTARIETQNADISSKVKNNLDIDIGAASIHSVNGRGRYMLNGKKIEREVIEGEF